MIQKRRSPGQIYQEGQQIVRYLTWCQKPDSRLSDFDYKRLDDLRSNPLVRGNYDWLKIVENLTKPKAGVVITGNRRFI